MDKFDFKIPELYNGYIVILNTLAKFYTDTRKDLYDYCNEIAEKTKDENHEDFATYNSHLQSFVTFGDFDRLSFNGVSRFSRYYDLDYRSKYWLGKHQNIFLYCIADKSRKYALYPYTEFDVETNEHDYGFCVKDYKKSSDSFCFSALTGDAVGENGKKDFFFPFFLLTQISFSNEAITRIKDYQEFLFNVKKELSKQLDLQIKEKEYEVYFDIYGCMNSSEIAVLWLCKQYGDVLALIDYLKDYKIKDVVDAEPSNINNNLFFSFYSIIGRTITNTPKVNALIKPKLEILGDERVRINITVGDQCSAVTLKKDLEEHIRKEKIELTEASLLGGQYDLTVKIPLKDLYTQFSELLTESEENGLFRNADIRKEIISIKTDLLAQVRDLSPTDEPKVMDIDLLPPTKRHASQFDKLHDQLSHNNDIEVIVEKDHFDSLSLRNLYLQIRYRLKSEFDSHTGSVDTLDMLYTDYLSNIHDTYNAIWRNDYHYQFKKSLRYLLELFYLEDDKKKEKFWEKFTETIDNIRQQTTHFSQSGRLVMQIPASHLRYTASADRLFHSYYGAAKVILENAYIKQEGRDIYQSELLPIITTNSTPMINSELYLAGDKCNDLRILQIDIPYSLLFDPITGFPYLVHELFHYFTPSDRARRNEIFLDIVINETLATAYTAQIETGLRKYIYSKYIEDPNFNGNNGCFSGEYASSNSNEFIKDFQDYMNKGSIKYPVRRITELKTSIAHVMWDNEVIKAVRSEISKEILNATEYGTDKTTWSDVLELFREKINSVTAAQKVKISEQLVDWMTNTEGKESDKKVVETIIHDNHFISCSIFLNDAANKIIYKHKSNLLNPYKIGAIRDNKTVFDSIQDIVLKGIREAIPDLAMVRYCEMSDIDYMVTYARFRQDNGYGETPLYDYIRLPIVLMWIDRNAFGATAGKKHKFNFEKAGIEFVEGYMAEYMPHSLNKEAISRIAFDAIGWHKKLCQLLRKFYREYDIYFEDIKEIFELYSFYFEGEYLKEFKELVETITLRRREKINIRRALLTTGQKKKIKEYLDKNAKVKFEDFSTDFNTMDYVQVSAYNRITDEYDNNTYERILEFVHKSTSQKTLEAIGDRVNTQKKIIDKGSNDGGDQNKVLTGAIDTIINQNDYYRAWGMSGFTSKIKQYCHFLRINKSDAPIWYKIIRSKEYTLPTSLNEVYAENYAGVLINGEIEEALQKYHEDNPERNKGLKRYTAVARMTIDSPLSISNLISWTGDLMSAFNSYFHDKQTEKDERNYELLLFSPYNYLSLRNESLLGTKNLLCANKNVPEIIYENNEINEQQAQYIYGNSTSSLVDNAITNFQNLATPSIAENELYKYYPIPMSFLEMEQDGRFLAYSLLTPTPNIMDNEFAKEISLEVIQEKLLKESISKHSKYDGNRTLFVQKNSFLYKIKIGREIVDEYFMLLGKSNR